MRSRRAHLDRARCARRGLPGSRRTQPAIRPCYRLRHGLTCLVALQETKVCRRCDSFDCPEFMVLSYEGGSRQKMCNFVTYGRGKDPQRCLEPLQHRATRPQLSGAQTFSGAKRVSPKLRPEVAEWLHQDHHVVRLRNERADPGRFERRPWIQARPGTLPVYRCDPVPQPEL